jgi:hypothetical protein
MTGSLLKRAPSQRPRRGIRFGFVAIVALLFLIVVALNWVVSGLPALLHPGIPAAGSVVYATGFDDPADPDWEASRGAQSAQITDGKLRLIADVPQQGFFAPLAYPLSDFDLRVVAKQTLGEDPYSEYGVIFRYQDNDNYYMFRLRSDGAYRVSRRLKGVPEDLSAATDPSRVPAPFMTGLNWANDIRIVAKGDHFSFFVNGKQLTLCPKGTDKRSTWNGDQCLSNNKQTAQELVDSTFKMGRAALTVYENTDKVAVDFDNLVIVAP